MSKDPCERCRCLGYKCIFKGHCAEVKRAAAENLRQGLNEIGYLNHLNIARAMK